MTIKIVTHGRRAHVLKRVINDRIDPDFVEDLYLNPEHVREGVYSQIKDPLYKRRLKAEVQKRIDADEAEARGA